MKQLLPLLSLTSVLLASQVAAQAKLTSLKVQEDVVYFAIEGEKTEASPSCMAAENSSKWTLSLNSASGKAMYALLVTASADDRAITVTTSNDCGDVIGYERAIAIELGAMAGTGPSIASATSVWKEVAIAYDDKGAWGRRCSVVLNSQKDGIDYLTRETYTSYRDPNAEYSNCKCNNGSTLVMRAGNNTRNFVSCLVPINE